MSILSSRSRSWQSSDDLDEPIGGSPTLSMPDDWTLSTAWQRAQDEEDRGGPINDAERMVRLSGSESVHRVTWALRGRTLIADCGCRGHQYHGGWCAHVASLWWAWVRGEIVVSHLDTGREYPLPPTWLRLDDDPARYDDLAPAQLDAYLACQLGDVGVREYARQTGRAPGTLGNHLRRARETLEGDR
ncbi:MAG: SWIM zinc finger family protein [Halapricum sp.]